MKAYLLSLRACPLKAVLAGLLLLIGCVNSAIASGLSTGNSLPEDSSLADAESSHNAPLLRYLVSGITENAQWPTPVSQVSLCVAGNPALLESLQAKPLQSRHGTVAIQSIDPQAQVRMLADCSVLFIGHQIPQNTALNWVLSLHNRPIVTIRENPEQCSSGAMICLYMPKSKVPTFDINLDSVSRSGVMLNPTVLTLTNNLPSDLLPP